MRAKRRGLQRDRKTGIWQIDKVVCGVRICKSTGTRDEQKAELELARLIEQVRQQKIYGVRPARTFRTAATKYLIEYAHKRSIGRDATALKDLDPYIGHLKLEAVHMDALKPYIDERLGKAVPSSSARPTLLARRLKVVTWQTIVRNVAVVRRILNLCARVWRDEDGKTWLETAPLLQLQKKGAKKRRPYPLDWDEQRLLFNELTTHLQKMALFAVNTGCREQEICQLQWEWEHQVQGVGSVFVVPEDIVKNLEPRVVVCNDVAQSIIDAQRGKHPTHVFYFQPRQPSESRVYRRRRMRERGLVELGRHLKTEELAPATMDLDLSPRPVARMNTTSWRQARKRAAERYESELGRRCPDGFRRVRVHDLKHTFGRRLRAAGVGFEDRQDLLGHKSGSVTTHYSAAELAELKRLANLVNEQRSSAVLLRVVGGAQ